MPQFPCLLIAGPYLQGVLGRLNEFILTKHLDKRLESTNYLANTAYYYCCMFTQIESPVYTQPHVSQSLNSCVLNRRERTTHTFSHSSGS